MITISPLNPENYQIRVVIPSDISQSDYPSIRFLENLGSGVPLPYWIERNENKYNSTGQVIVWVRRLENADNTIYMYYGNASATKADNGDNTFLFFDDFGGGTGGQGALNTNKWGSSGTGVDVFENYLRLEDWGDAEGRIEHGPGQGLSASERDTQRVLEWRVNNNSTWRGPLNLDGNGWGNKEMAEIFYDGANNKVYQDGRWGTVNLAGAKWYIGNLVFWGSGRSRVKYNLYYGADNAQYRQLRDGTLDNFAGDWANNGGWYFDKYKFRVWDGGGNSSYYLDWVFVRKTTLTYGNDQEPVATLGLAEGNYSVDVSISPSAQEGLVSENLVYNVVVKNTGWLPDNYFVTMSEALGWSHGGLKDKILTGDLIISEYIEGSSYNKALEIYNGTSSPVDLSGYKLELYSNGATTASQTKVLSGTLNSGDVWVGVNPQANAAIKAVADWIDNTNGVINWNGDDGIRLARVSDNSTIDCIGQLGVRPSPEWPGLGGGQDSTEVRKENVTWGDTNFNDNFNFENCHEWDNYGIDNTSFLGWHGGTLIGPLNPGENWTGQIWVVVSGTPCTTDTLTVNAISINGSGISDNDTCTAHSKVVCGVDVEVEPPMQEGWPSQVLQFTINVHNSGNVVDNINLSVIPNEWFPDEWIDPPVLENVMPSEWRQATLYVHIPDGYPPSYLKEIVVVAESQVCGATDNDSVIVHVVEAPQCGVDVTIVEDLLEGYPSQVLAYTIDVHNSGNVVDNISLNYIPDGWPDITIIPPVLIDVMPSEHRQATMFIHVPDGAQPSTYKEIIVVAESQICHATDNDNALAHVIEQPVCGVDVTIDNRLLEGWPSQVLAYTISVHNSGNVVDNIFLSVIPDGWPDISIVPPVLIDVMPCETRQATVFVHVPDQALPSTYKEIIVVAESQFCGATDNDNALAHVIEQPLCGVDVTIVEDLLEGYPSQWLAYTIDVHNSGNVVDNIFLSYIPDGWPDITIVPPVLIDVMPSEHRQAMMFVHVPDGAQPCTYKEIIVVAESQFCGATDNDNAFAHVVATPPPYSGTATFKLENLYKVNLYKDNLWLNQGSKLVVKFYKYDNVTFQTESVIHENWVIPWHVVPENENVPQPRAAERYSWGTVQIARLVLTTDNTENVISTIASFTVHQSNLRSRYMAILADWGNHPEQQSAFRAEVMDILSQWSSAPP